MISSDIRQPKLGEFVMYNDSGIQRLALIVESSGETASTIATVTLCVFSQVGTYPKQYVYQGDSYEQWQFMPEEQKTVEEDGVKYREPEPEPEEEPYKPPPLKGRCEIKGIGKFNL